MSRLGLSPTPRRYYLPNDRPLEGWAEIVITDGGFFAAVSDYGNYAFAWRHFGSNFREFLLGAERDADYFIKKLQPGGDGPGDEYDGEATAFNVRRLILEYRREGLLDRDRARAEWDLVTRYENLYSQYDFNRWYEDTELEDAAELACYRRNQQAKTFVERILAARLVPILRAELAAERIEILEGSK